MLYVCPACHLLAGEGQRPLAHLHRRAAAGAAIAQGGPARPAAEALVLAVRRAVRHLLGHVGVAQLAALVGHAQHAALPVALPAALRAVPPVRPGAPEAVLTTKGRSQRIMDIQNSHTVWVDNMIYR